MILKESVYSYLKELKNNLVPPGENWRSALAIPLTLLYTAAATLILIKFGFQSGFFQYFSNLDFFQKSSPEELKLWSQVYLSFNSVLFFVLFPLVLHLAFPVGAPLGTGIRGATKELPIAGLMIAIMLPILWFSFADPAFHNFYPMYNPPSLKLWLLYEAIYLSHFFTVEFFFRGFLLFRFEKSFPGYGVWITLIPYCLIHLYKPFPEAIGSLFAGYLLGVLALSGRSIWPGILVHVCVAFFADFFALIHSGRWALLLSL